MATNICKRGRDPVRIVEDIAGFRPEAYAGEMAQHLAGQPFQPAADTAEQLLLGGAVAGLQPDQRTLEALGRKRGIGHEPSIAAGKTARHVFISFLFFLGWRGRFRFLGSGGTSP
jgi:hypothetical protein